MDATHADSRLEISLMRGLVLLLSLLVLAACVPGQEQIVFPTSIASATASQGPPLTLKVPLAPTPGLALRGQVRTSGGIGLANITICRNFASYPGIVVATTDQSGNFQAAFASIPGDEMVGVWPGSAGYTYDPPYYRWRHYFGPEDRNLDFVAVPGSSTNTPLAPCQ